MREPFKLVLDARCLNTDHVRGMGKYLQRVSAEAAACGEFELTFLGDRPESPMQLPAMEHTREDRFEVRGHRFHLWEQIGLPRRARGAHALHCTGNTLCYWQPIPTIATVHDTLLWEARPSGFQRWYLERLIPAAFDKCYALITISEASRRDILNRWPLLDSKLHVIHHGVDDTYLYAPSAPLPEEIRAQIGADAYLLYLGGALERKRFQWAVELFEALADSRLTLVACGFTKAEAAVETEKLRPAVRDRVRFMGFVSESAMPLLYLHATAVLYPTLYEGFGFPALEAQAVGTPVLFSPLGSLSELRGPGSIVVPADDKSAWLAALRRAISERRGEHRQNEAARVWARSFSWSVSARKHIELYRRAAEHGRRFFPNRRP